MAQTIRFTSTELALLASYLGTGTGSLALNPQAQNITAAATLINLKFNTSAITHDLPPQLNPPQQIRQITLATPTGTQTLTSSTTWTPAWTQAVAVLRAQGRSILSGPQPVDKTRSVSTSTGQLLTTVLSSAGATTVTTAAATVIQGVVGPQGPQGPAGATGAQGVVGPQGLAGQNALDVSSFEIDHDGNLIVMFSDSSTVNLGLVVGPAGPGGAANAVSTVRNTITATAGQTVFVTAEYVVGAGQLRVYINGVRLLPSEYTETSITSFTLNVGVSVGTLVFVEIDAFVGQSIIAANVVNTAAGNIVSTTVQNAINELDQEKAPLASPTFTGTVGGITAAMVGLGNVTNESKATMFASPAFTGTPTGITAAHVGLGNVTNESKGTMFASPAFTGTVTGVSQTAVGLGNVTNESKATMFANPAFTGTPTGVTAAHVGLANVTNESKATMFASPTFTGTVGGITAAMIGLANVTNESKATMFASPAFTGTPTGITAAHVGLGNVNNTTDANKPISTATQTALDLKVSSASPTFSGAVAFSPATTVNFSNATVSGLVTTVSEFPSGTKMMFAQTNAPTGWTKDTTHNDKAIRVVSGAVVNGGSVNFTSAFSSQGVSGTVAGNTASGSTGFTNATGTINANSAGGSVSVSGTVGSTTLTIAQMPIHNHTVNNLMQKVANRVGQLGTYEKNDGAFNTESTEFTGGSTSHDHTFSGFGSFSGGSHDHTWSPSSHNHSVTVDSHSHTFTGTAINLQVAYVDVIIATKN